jgi:hypothetical protein
LHPRGGVFRCAFRATRREKATSVLRAGIWLSRLGRQVLDEQVLVEAAKRLFLLCPSLLSSANVAGTNAGLLRARSRSYNLSKFPVNRSARVTQLSSCPD